MEEVYNLQTGDFNLPVLQVYQSYSDFEVVFLLKKCITVKTSLYGTEVIAKCSEINLLHSEFIKPCLP